jgi:transposase
VLKPSCEELLEVIDELKKRLLDLENQLAEKDRQIDELKRLIEELRRTGKRQASPFSKGAPKTDPLTPGRKPGRRYGRQSTPAIPKRVDETVVVPCPLFCSDSDCSGTVRLTGKASQYQIDVPPIAPRVTEFVVHYGHCRKCGRRAQGRDARQVSNALGIGSIHLGPGVIALAGHLNKVGGLSYEKVAAFFAEALGLKVARSTLCRALGRLAQKAWPTYGNLINKIRASPTVYPDETGWRVGGRSAWLWAFTDRRVTVYAIEPGRGFAEAATVLGDDYGGVLGCDGWAPYRRFTSARRQTCLAHLLRRSNALLETASGAAAQFPASVKSILKDALRLRDRWHARRIGAVGLRIAKGRLEARTDRLLDGVFDDADNRRFALHLLRNREALFLFLERPDVEATNWPAEQAIRPAVVNRKSCGGNRTVEGAETQSVLTSILRTCRQQRRNPIAILSAMLRSPQPRVFRLVPCTR